MIHSNKRLIIVHANSQKKLIILSLHWVRFNEVKRKVSSIYIDVVTKTSCFDKKNFLTNVRLDSSNYSKLAYSPKLFI